jgi:quercetin dioxygenase-like cupin family protein
MTLDDANVTVTHHFGYWKRTLIPAGVELAQHNHKAGHHSLLMKGAARVETDTSRRVYYAPSIVFIPAGKPHKVTALESVEWWCLWETDERDIAKIDEALIENP